MSVNQTFDLQSIPESRRERFFINGDWQLPHSGRRLDIISPVTEERLLSVPEASTQDVDAAIAAARHAFDAGPWPRQSPRERAVCLRAIAAGLRRRKELLEQIWTAQVGAPASFVRMLSDFTPGLFDYYATVADVDEFVETTELVGGRALLVREPMGVAAIISPWNAPLILMSYGVAAGLAAGCTIVAKPSPETPLEAQILAECIQEAGVPPGVFNVVPGGRETGSYLVSHPQVDKVAFTGSVSGGKQVSAACAPRLARTSLELGGKSAAIILDDADLPSTLAAVVPFSMPFSGQICFSLTRVLVPRRRKDEITEAYVAAARQITVGDPWDPQTQMGPLSMQRQFERVCGYVRKGREEGARLATGGERPDGFVKGYFMQPTVFTDVDNDMTIAREEIFGPVVSLITYEDDADAIKIANSSEYGLSGAVFSRDTARALHVARQIRAGNVTVNGLRIEPSVPFGGFKQSGIGRAGGAEGLRSFQELKAIYVNG